MDKYSRFKLPVIVIVALAGITVIGAYAIASQNTNNGGSNQSGQDNTIQAEVRVVVTYSGSFSVRIMSNDDTPYQKTYENSADVLVRVANPEDWTVGVSAKKLDGGSGTSRIQIWGANGELLKDSETRTPDDMDLAVWRTIPVSSAYPQYIDSTNRTSTSIIEQQPLIH